MQNHNEIFLQNIKQHKKRINVTNEALALSIGITTRQFSRWMSGDPIPDKHHEKIAHALRVDLSELKSEGDDDHAKVVQSEYGEIELFPFTCRVSQHSMNGFSLLKSRFGLSKSEIVEWAPALFYLLASQAVEDLQIWVDHYQKQVENAPEGFAPDEEYKWDYTNKLEMLDSRDVFGEQFGRTFDHARIPIIDSFIKLANAQRNEISPEYFGNRDLEGHLPRARVLLDWETCEKLARGDTALASAIQDSSILCPVNESDEAFASTQRDFKKLLQHHRETQHERRRYYELEKERSLDQSTHSETVSNSSLRIKRRSVHWFLQPTRAWEAKLWRELDREYGEYQYAELDEGFTL